jgi:adenine phosphoribosyltransferase
LIDLAALVRDIPDFPKPGIVFKDITPVLADPAGLDAAVAALAEFARPLDVDLVVGAEARGFLLGPALARELGAGFVLARKPGKLPHTTVQAEYALEYGTDTLEIHSDAIHAGSRVLVHDDLLATGGDGERDLLARRAARRHRRRLRVPHRAGVPARARAPRGSSRAVVAQLRLRVTATSAARAARPCRVGRACRCCAGGPRRRRCSPPGRP